MKNQEISFAEAFKKALVAKGISFARADPYDMVMWYEGLVRRIVEEGYSDFLVEYDNDISVRNIIETMIHERSLENYDEMNILVERVRAADELLKNSFLVGKEREHELQWWDRGIVRNGSGDYAEDIKLEYGIILESGSRR